MKLSVIWPSYKILSRTRKCSCFHPGRWGDTPHSIGWSLCLTYRSSLKLKLSFQIGESSFLPQYSWAKIVLLFAYMWICGKKNRCLAESRFSGYSCLCDFNVNVCVQVRRWWSTKICNWLNWSYNQNRGIECNCQSSEQHMSMLQKHWRYRMSITRTFFKYWGQSTPLC